MTEPSESPSEAAGEHPSFQEPQLDVDPARASSGALRLGSIVSAACATLIVLVELLVTDAGITFGLKAIFGGGMIFAWIVFAVGAVGCCYLSFRFMDSALAVERDLTRSGF
jgi:hypothetical protein